MGLITETATSAPGSSGVRPNTKAPLATTLKLNGYSTAQFGKCHEVPPWQTSPVGPFDAWPSGGGGFETFYGFIGGENNQYYPALYDGFTPVEPEKTPEEGYHLTEDLADRAIGWVQDAEGAGAGQAVLRVLRAGCDARAAPCAAGVGGQVQGPVRRRLGRAARVDLRAPEAASGSWPADAELTPRPDAIPAWDDMDEALKPVLERQMEVYAGFLEHTDFHVGRLLDAVEEIGALDNTLVYYIIGDNGASAEGTLNGAFNEMANFNGMSAIETPEFMASVKDKLGTTEAYNHYAVGWAWAMCTPYQWTKQVASHWGGTRNGTIVHWPDGIKSKGEIRNQFSHVIDMAPTILEAAGLPEPTFVNGVQQAPIEGTSMVYSFDRRRRARAARSAVLRDGREPGHLPQGLERGHPAQHAVAAERALPALDDDVWELYDGNTDWTQAHDLAAEDPDRLAALQRLWLIEAVKYNVLPIDDRRFERLNATIAGRPQLITGTTQTLFPGMKRLSENSVIDIKNRSFSVTAAIETAEQGPTEGVIIAQGGRFGGWALYVRDGHARFVYNVLGMQEFVDRGDGADPGRQQPGAGRVRLRRRRARQGRRRDPLLRRPRRR